MWLLLLRRRSKLSRNMNLNIHYNMYQQQFQQNIMILNYTNECQAKQSIVSLIINRFI